MGADEAAAAERELDPAATRAIHVAIDNIRRFHAAQASGPLRVETVPGVVCERVVRPLRAVGLYVPAGRVTDAPVNNIDWIPTLLDLAGAAPPSGAMTSRRARSS